MKVPFAAVLLLVLAASPVLAQVPPPMALTRLTGPIVLDGPSFEPAWEAVEPLPLVQYEPHPGQPPTERTEIRVAYDAHSIYFSLRAYDRNRNGIRANTLYRDRLAGDDHFEILLDTFNDNETGIVFTTTPAGLRTEASLHNDGSGSLGAFLNRSYNTFWDVETEINDQGWFAEMRIPFSSLRFQDDDGRVVMGFSVQRKIARRAERLVFPAVPPSISWGFLRPSYAQKIVMEGVFGRNPVYVTPYGLSGLSHNSGWDGNAGGYLRDNDFRRELGVDLRYGLTNNLHLDLTVNTDFAQAEADDQQVNLTRFSLFYPEKRQFFQERSGVFEFPTGGQSRLFHSRRIGLTDDGQPVRLLGGARLVGRVGDWDVGLIEMQTADSRSLPSENLGVVRLRRRVLNDYSYAGVMATNRISMEGGYSAAYGVDGVVRLIRDDYLAFQWAQTFDSDLIDSGDMSALNSGRLNVLVERRRREAFGYSAGFTWSGRQHNPGLGFVQRHDFTRVAPAVSYTWLPGEPSRLLWHTLAFASEVYVRNADGAAETVEAGPRYEFARRSGASGSIGLQLVYEDLLAPFAISRDAIVPAGSYTFYRAAFGYRMPNTNMRQLGFDLDVGTFFDGWQTTVGVSPVWYVSPHLELSGEYDFSMVRFPERDQRFDAHVARLRIGTALNTEVSTIAFLQYNSATRAFSANVRFRYNFREGNDLWIVFNQSDWVDMRPVLPAVDNRTLLLKYTYTFSM